MRNLDTKNLREVIAIIDQMIADVDYELQYIMVITNSQARIYLNTLGFFFCLKDKIQRDIDKQNYKINKEKKEIKKFYNEFMKDMLFKKKLLLSQISPEDMDDQDRKNAG